MSTYTPADLANELQMDEDEVERLRKVRGWPHLKPNRKTVRYTPAQVEQIKASITVTSTTVNPSNGQTARSAKRSAS